MSRKERNATPSLSEESGPSVGLLPFIFFQSRGRVLARGCDAFPMPLNNRNDATGHCCAECGVAGGISLKVCKSCMQVRYCNAICQRNHWSTHKKDCKRRKAELRDEALFKDPPAMEDCPICFLPMPVNIFSCASFPPATLSSVPVHDFAIANEGLEDKHMEQYLPCCGKNICRGCEYSSVNTRLGLGLGFPKCPFCNSDQSNKTDEEIVEEI